MTTETRILVVGSGAREHAILNKLASSLEDNPNTKLYCYGTNNNPGIVELLEQDYVEDFNYFGVLSDIDSITTYALEKKITITIIGPERPLANGLVDLMQEHGIQCVGPTKNSAKIETSKSFTRNLLIKAQLDHTCPLTHLFTNKDNNSKESILNILKKNYNKTGFVIKVDGLCGGKGVFVQGDHFPDIESGLIILLDLLQKHEKVLVEEKLVGEEFSYMTFCDGNNHYSHTFPIQDYKRVYDGDKGPNTGSMGSISLDTHLFPFLDEGDIEECKQINEIVARQIQKETGEVLGFRGILYGSFMKTTEDIIKVIEYNSRLGDPEGVHIMRLMDNDFIKVCKQIVRGELTEPLSFTKESLLTIYAVPFGYPDNPIKNHEIYIHKVKNKENLYFGAVHYVHNDFASPLLYETGSRAVLYASQDRNIETARNHALKEIECIQGPLFYRKDIGVRMLPDYVEKRTKTMTYKSSGVDISYSEDIIDSVKQSIVKTYGSNVISGVGSFGGVVSVPEDKKNNLLVASIDGVGTKVDLVRERFGAVGFFELGLDIVHHSVNDILVQGAKPLLFMDYIGSSQLNKKEIQYLINGMCRACIANDCCLIAGETAEMPGVYHKNKTDIVGSIIGTVAPNNIINGKKTVKKGDFIYGLPSSGPHTNGYTLIRRILEKVVFTSREEESLVFRELSRPHRSYLNEVESLQDKKIPIHALCHITGGGFYGNIPRVLPKNLSVILKSWDLPDIFTFLQEKGNISTEEMRKVFNCGVGLLLFTKCRLEEIPEVSSEWTYLGYVVDRFGDDSQVSFV